jgi:hypothetical protein
MPTAIRNRPPRRAAAPASRPSANDSHAGDRARIRVKTQPAARWQYPLEYGKLGRVLKMDDTIVAKAWRRPRLQPHRFEPYMQPDGPHFESKAADVIGLYLNPPDHAAMFAVGQKTAIHAPDRLYPVLPPSSGRAERRGFEYYRPGTLSLFAALNTRSGEVLGHAVPRHTSAASVYFLGDIVTSQPAGREIHVIADNLSTHKTQSVRTFCWRVRTCRSISRPPVRRR